MTRSHRVENEYNLGLQLRSRKFCLRSWPQRRPQLTHTEAYRIPTIGSAVYLTVLHFPLSFPCLPPEGRGAKNVARIHHLLGRRELLLNSVEKHRP